MYVVEEFFGLKAVQCNFHSPDASAEGFGWEI